MRIIIMKRIILILLVLISFNLTNATDVSGPVSGVWMLVGSPYCVIAEIYVPSDSLLVIEPGVQVIFRGRYKFNVMGNALLSAIGTEEDTILFTPAIPDTGWQGIRFLSSSDSSIIAYCHITYAQAYEGPITEAKGAGIYIENCNVTIQNCLIDFCEVNSNYDESGGGGICCNSGSSSLITLNKITNNSSHKHGGGIFVLNSSPIIISNDISGNFTYNRGGGIYSKSSATQIIGNNISGNRCGYSTGFYATPGTGAGIDCNYSNDTIEENTIVNNIADTYSYLTYSKGGGIYCCYSSPVIIANTIVNNMSQSYGGGILCSGCDSIVIEENIINDNHADDEGAGIYLNECECGTLDRNSIADNYSEYGYGGGIFIYDANIDIVENVIARNYSDGGGGIFCENYFNSIELNTIYENSCYLGGMYGGGIMFEFSSPIIMGNLLWDNSAIGYGGAIFFWYCPNPQVVNNTLVNNFANLGSAIACYSGNTIALNSILMNPGGDEIYLADAATLEANYCSIRGGWPGVGNIDTDPLFVDTVNNDFHLQSTIGSYHGGLWLPDPDHSPCIDAGDPASQYGNEPEPNGGRVNMGAYGNTAEASLSNIVVVNQNDPGIPISFKLYPPHPNPFNPSTTISYALPEACEVELIVYDIRGREVRTLVNQQQSPGVHEVTFDGSDLASGIYVYHIEAGEYERVNKMVLLK